MKTFTKFEIDNKIYYVKVLWKPNTKDLFDIKIYDDDKTWSGEFSFEAAHNYIEQFDVVEDEYYNDVKKSLLKADDFQYSFSLNEDDSAEFTWRKLFRDLDAVLDHGSVTVHRDEVTESKNSLIDDLLAENKNLKDSIDKLNINNDDLNKELVKSKNHLEEFKDIKTTLEATLYGKFVQILNAKKRRIQLLEENLSKVSKSNQVADEMD